MKYLRFKFKFKETVATILVDRKEDYEKITKAIIEARREIEDAISKDPLFLTTYEPYECSGKVTGRMCYASKLAKVGPMAAVAGAIAQYAVESVADDVNFAVVDNGGDMAILTDRELVVGIYPSNIGFVIEPCDEIVAICTSSGKIGHSVSLGYADAATVVSNDASIADAFATALGNEIKEELGKEEIEGVLSAFWERAGKYISGAMVVKDEILGFVGNLPKIVRVKINPDLITF